jgi:hypothetical protein
MSRIFAYLFEGLNFEIVLESGFAVIAGPNGVGKSHILQSIAGRPDPFVFRGRPNPHGVTQRAIVSVDNAVLTSVTLFNLQDLQNAGISLLTSPSIGQLSDNVRNVAGQIKPELFENDVKLPNINSREARDLKMVISFANSEEKELLKTAELAQKIAIVERILLREKQYVGLHELAPTFSRYHLQYAQLKYEGHSIEAISSQIGVPPWERMNDAFRQLGFQYEVRAPDLNKWPGEFARFELFHIGRNDRVGGAELSGGERVVLQLYGPLFSNLPIQSGAVFLFDDIDGFVHPPLLKRLIGLLHKTIVVEGGGFVFWATHSPVFVQLTQNADYFYIGKYGTGPVRTTKAKLIHELTGGELVVFENTCFVFVEGVEHEFYNELLDRLEKEEIVELNRQVKFISPKANVESSGANKAAVIESVKVLRKCGLSKTFAGLVDRDTGQATPIEGISQLERYSVENYWSDPLN